MTNLLQFLKRHQLIAYFVLTYLFTWTLALIFQPLYLHGHKIVSPFISLGIFAPALVSIGLSAILKPNPRQGSRKRALITFFIIWVLASLVITLYLIYVQKMTFSPRLVLVDVITGMFPAFVGSCVFSTIPGVKEHLQTYIKPRGNLFYYLAALFLLPAVWLLGNLLSRLFGVEIPFIKYPSVDLKFLGMAALTFLYNVAYSALSEEPGWRGFALPRLQAKFNPLVSSLILGVVWSFWHAPFKFGGMEAASLPNIIIEWALIILVNFFFTWLFNRTKGSILVTALLHPTINTLGNFLNTSLGSLFLLVVFIAAIIVLDKMWKKLPADHPAAYLANPQTD